MSDYLPDLKDGLNSIEFCLNKGDSKVLIKSSELLAKLEILEESLLEKVDRYQSGLRVLMKSSCNSEIENKIKIGMSATLSCLYQINQLEQKIEGRECKVTQHVSNFIQNV